MLRFFFPFNFAFPKTFRIIAVLKLYQVGGDRPPSIRWRIFYVYHSTHDKRMTACTPYPAV